MTERLSQNIWLKPALILSLSLCIAHLLVEISSIAFVIASLILIVASIGFFSLSPGLLFPLYFLYLILEGAIKILSNYNPLLHVGSDVLLLAIFWRLYQRRNAEPNIANLNVNHFADLRIFTVAITIYWGWVAIQFFNPVSLGLLPSIAGLKIHVVPYLCFFIVCLLLKEKEVRKLAPWFLLLVTFEAAFAIYDWTQGVAFLGRVSSRYVFTYYNFLKGVPYRPFGTTALPGAPSVWVAHGTLALFIVYYLQKETIRESIKNRSHWKAVLWLWIALYLPLAYFTLIVCQVRSLFIRTVLLCFAGVAMQGRRHLVVLLFAVGALIGWNQLQGPSQETVQTQQQITVANRFEAAIGRMKTLRSVNTYTNARGGNWAFKEMGRRAEYTMGGIGLSRSSASAGPWTDRIKADRLFGPGWSFSDNVFLALFTELGAGGLIAYVCLVFTAIFTLFRKQNVTAKLIAVYALLIFTGGYASEGNLYQPEASFFWTYIGIGYRLGNSV